MSAASCLLRWQTSPALATLFRNRNHQTHSFVSSFSARSNVHWGFATSEVQRFSPASLFLVCKEVRGCGIEAVITKVENCLADGNLLEAAATLEKGLEGTKGEELVTVWVRQACNRIVAEQAVTMVQAHAIAVVSALV